MPAGKSLGIFENEKDLYLIQAAGNTPARSSTFPLPLDDQAGASADVRLTALIQKALRTEYSGVTQVKISIPTVETLVRSFIVPFMKPTEIAAGVEFEIKKHVPFNLEDLVYTYNSIPITQDNVRKILIAFAVVRRSYLERRVKILEQAGLEVVLAEPAPISMVRALMAKKIISTDQNGSVLQLEEGHARLLFLLGGAVVFMREFSLPASAAAQEPAQRSRFINEVHNSFEFFHHQYGQKAEQMVVFSSLQEGPYEQWIQQDITISVKNVRASTLTGIEAGNQMAVVNAFGVSLARELKTKYSFDFLQRQGGASEMFSFSFDISEFSKSIRAAVICAVVLAGAHFFVRFVALAGPQQEVQQLEARQAEFADKSIEDIKDEAERNGTRRQTYAAIPIKSDVTSLLAGISLLLPEGIWLESFHLVTSKVPESQQLTANLTLDAFAYAEDPNSEIPLVYDFVNRLKKDKKMAARFKSFTLVRIQSQERSDGNVVVSFQLVCT